MTLLQEAPDVSPQRDDSSPVVPEVLFKEARAHGRRRRLLVIIPIVVVAMIAATLATIAAGAGATPPIAAAASRPTATTTPTVPTFLVTYDHDPIDAARGGAAVGIVVMSPTGKIIRTLVPGDNDTIDEGGFVLSPDRSTLYYTVWNTTHLGLEIMSVPIKGGPARFIAAGNSPLISPDGSTMVYHLNGKDASGWLARGFASPKIAILSLATGQTSTTTIPAVKSDQDVEMSWLSNSAQIFVDAKSSLVNPCPPDAIIGRACDPVSPSLTPHAFVLDVATKAWTVLPAATRAIATPGWPVVAGRSVEALIGPGPRPGTVTVLGSESIRPGTSVESVGALDIETGTVAWGPRMPSSTLLQASATVGSGSGSEYLISGNGGAKTGAYIWSPSRPNSPILLRGADFGSRYPTAF
jgi:hypothetical protein